MKYILKVTLVFLAYFSLLVLSSVERLFGFVLDIIFSILPVFSSDYSSIILISLLVGILWQLFAPTITAILAYFLLFRRQIKLSLIFWLATSVLTIFFYFYGIMSIPFLKQMNDFVGKFLAQ